MPRFRKMHPVDDGWSEWVAPIQGYKMACCDCDLVHNVEFKVMKVTEQSPDGKGFEADEVPWGEYRILLRAKRNKRSTAQMRRGRKKRA